MLFLFALLSQLLVPQSLTTIDASPHPVVIIDSVRTHPNSTFTLPIFFHGLDSLTATSYQFSLNYDSSLLVLDSLRTKGTVSESGLLQSSEHIPGLLHVAGAHKEPLPSSGLLMELVFTTKEIQDSSSMFLSTFMFNEGGMKVTLTPGFIDIVAPQFRISADTIRVQQNHTFSLPIWLLYSDTPLYSGFFSIGYDSALITPIGISREESLLSDPSSFIDYTISSPGLLHVAFASSSPLQAEELPLAFILFESKELPGESPIRLVEVVMNEGPSVVTAANGLVIVEPTFRWGDTNEDLEISVVDAVYILRHLLRVAQLEGNAQQAADVSGNNTITSYDASLILQYAHELISCFPVEPSCKQSKSRILFEEVARRIEHPFSWNYSRVTPEKYTLYLDTEAEGLNIYSLDITIPLSPGNEVSLDSYAHLPEDWIVFSNTSNQSYKISLAGSSPLPVGPVLAIKGPEFKSHLLINGQPSDLFVVANQQSGSSDIAITEVYPIPFKHIVNLRYSITHPTAIQITLFDALGRRVKELYNGHVEAGVHHLHTDGLALSPGMYTLRLVTQEGQMAQTQVIKL